MDLEFTSKDAVLEGHVLAFSDLCAVKISEVEIQRGDDAVVENLFQIVEKSHTLAPHRYSLVLRKVGCPVGCSEWLPVTKPFFDECEEGELIEVKTKRVAMTVDEAHKYVTARRSQIPVTDLWKSEPRCEVGKSCGIEEYDPQQV